MMTTLQMPTARSARPRFTATVHAPDGVLFEAGTDSPRALTRRVVEYIAERCDHVLWPADAAEVRALIGAGKLEVAIATYFARVGERWDAERLELGGVTP
jgi:hypothetical protein